MHILYVVPIYIHMSKLEDVIYSFSLSLYVCVFLSVCLLSLCLSVWYVHIYGTCICCMCVWYLRVNMSRLEYDIYNISLSLSVYMCICLSVLYMHVWYMHVCMLVLCPCMCICLGMQQLEDDVCLYHFLPSSLGTGSLPESTVCLVLTQLPGQRVLVVSCQPWVSYHMCYIPRFLHECWESEFGSSCLSS